MKKYILAAGNFNSIKRLITAHYFPRRNNGLWKKLKHWNIKKCKWLLISRGCSSPTPTFKMMNLYGSISQKEYVEHFHHREHPISFAMSFTGERFCFTRRGVGNKLTQICTAAQKKTIWREHDKFIGTANANIKCKSTLCTAKLQSHRLQLVHEEFWYIKPLQLILAFMKPQN